MSEIAELPCMIYMYFFPGSFGVDQSLWVGTLPRNGSGYTVSAGHNPYATIGYEPTASSKTSPLKFGCVLVPWNMRYWTRAGLCLIWLVTKIQTQPVGTIGEVYIV